MSDSMEMMSAAPGNCAGKRHLQAQQHGHEGLNDVVRVGSGILIGRFQLVERRRDCEQSIRALAHPLQTLDKRGAIAGKGTDKIRRVFPLHDAQPADPITDGIWKK